MTRMTLASVAIAAVLSASTALPAVSQSVGDEPAFSYQALKFQYNKVVPRQLKSNRSAVPCDCTNCSAQHCQPKYRKFQLRKLPLTWGH